MRYVQFHWLQAYSQHTFLAAGGSSIHWTLWEYSATKSEVNKYRIVSSKLHMRASPLWYKTAPKCQRLKLWFESSAFQYNYNFRIRCEGCIELWFIAFNSAIAGLQYKWNVKHTDNNRVIFMINNLGIINTDCLNSSIVVQCLISINISITAWVVDFSLWAPHCLLPGSPLTI